MKFNSEFLDFLSGQFANAAREVLAERLLLPLAEIPLLHFDEEVPGDMNKVKGIVGSQTLLRVKSRPEDGSPYAVRVNPSAIEAQANLFLAQEDEIARVAQLYDIPESDIKASLIQGAGFDVVVRSLLQVVNSTADFDELVTVREVAKQRLGLESRTPKE